MEAPLVALLLPSCFLALYFVLEAADWGLSLAAPLVTRNQEENKAVLALLRPALDGNELWFFMGFFMLSLCLPDVRNSNMHPWYMTMVGLISVGAVLRMAAVLLVRPFSSRMMMKGLSAYSLVTLFLTGLLGTALFSEGDGIFSLAGVFCAIWTVFACFQLGCLYGAVKAANPLGERFRAAFLVSSCLSVIAYILFAVILRFDLGESWEAGGYFWMSLIAMALLFAAAFILTRSRHPEAGLAAAYASAFFAMAIYFSACVMVTPQIHVVDIDALKAGMDAVPGTLFLMVTAVWSLVVFGWRMIRKKVVYTWQDHI